MIGSIKGFSVLLYQHFERTKRDQFVRCLGSELAGMTDAKLAYSFWTLHVVFFLVPIKAHVELILPAIERVRESPWAMKGSCPTSRTNGQKQILVGKHTPNA